MLIIISMSSVEWYKNNGEAKKEHQRRYRENNKDKIKKTRDVWNENNREAKKEHQRRYRENNKDKVKKSRAGWYEKNREHINKYQLERLEKKENKMKQMIYVWKRAGIISDDWNSIFNIWYEATECWCCNKFFEKGDKCLDHDHETGEPRAILCRVCNWKDRWIKEIIEE